MVDVPKGSQKSLVARGPRTAPASDTTQLQLQEARQMQDADLSKELTAILVDLTRYEYKPLVRASLALLVRHVRRCTPQTNGSWRLVPSLSC